MITTIREPRKHRKNPQKRTQFTTSKKSSNNKMMSLIDGRLQTSQTFIAKGPTKYKPKSTVKIKENT